MNIIATIGNESHTSSSGWAKLTINGKRMSYREAVSKEFLTKFGDKHATWCECVFSVNPGDKITWEAGTNTGNRGANRWRLNLRFVVDADAEVLETEDPGYPASKATLKGRLRIVEDIDAQVAAKHEALKQSL